MLRDPGSADPTAAAAQALYLIEAAVERERDALESIRMIYSGTPEAEGWVNEELAAWKAYGHALRDFILERASWGGAGGIEIPESSPEDLAFDGVVPVLARGIRGQEFSLGQYGPAQSYFQQNPGVLAEVGLSNSQTQQILGFIDGRRSVLTIRNRVAGWTGTDLSVTQVARYLTILEEIGWVDLEGRGP